MTKKTTKKKEPTTNKKMSALNRKEFMANVSLVRAAALDRLVNPGKNINFECGYPDSITTEDYALMYARNGAANKVVRFLPEETWAIPPEIYETEDANDTAFELAWNELDDQKKIMSYLQRIDVLSGIGEFGVLLLGLDDGGELSTPVPGINEKTGEKVENSKELKLLFLKAFDQSSVAVTKKESSTSSPRFGFPTMYSIQFEAGIDVESDTSKEVHWTRLIHIADGRESSETYGTPRMKPVYNRLLDLRKILCGSGEMFWRGGYPGLAVETNPEPGDTPLDIESTKDHVEDFAAGMSRFIALEGATIKSLQVQIASPKDHVEAQMRAIAFALGVPWRIFVGSEAAVLASGQDVKAWNKRVFARQTYYVNPYVIRPLLDRLIMFGVLPEPADGKYVIDWPDLNAPTDEDKAKVALIITEAISKYVAIGGDALIPPMEFLTEVLGFTQEVADSIEKAAGGFDDFGEDENDEGDGSQTEDNIVPQRTPE